MEYLQGLIPDESLHCVRLDANIDIAILGIVHLHQNGVLVRVENGNHGAVVWPLKDSHHNVVVSCFGVVVQSHRVGHQEFGEMAHRVEEWLLVVLVTGLVHDDGRVYKITYEIE